MIELLSWLQQQSPKQLMVIAGPCVIETESMIMKMAEYLSHEASKRDLLLVFKASFDKANRSSHLSFRGLGQNKGLQILEKVKKEFGLLVITDVHEDSNINEVAEVVDILQTPAMLCRQTNFIQKVARAGKPVHLKKGQFLAPWEMAHVVAKCHEAGNHQLLLGERGSCFGYQNLVVDFRSFGEMRKTGCSIVFDATHSVQLPGQLGQSSGGERHWVPLLSRAAVAAGVDAIFTETHPNPAEALSDGPNSIPMEDIGIFWDNLLAIHQLTIHQIRLEDKWLHHATKGP